MSAKAKRYSEWVVCVGFCLIFQHSSSQQNQISSLKFPTQAQTRAVREGVLVQAFGDSGISLVSQNKRPLCAPLPRSTSSKPLPEFHVTRAHPILSHLQQQHKQQTTTEMMMMPANTDMVMIRIWKLTVKQEEESHINTKYNKVMTEMLKRLVMDFEWFGLMTKSS